MDGKGGGGHGSEVLALVDEAVKACRAIDEESRKKLSSTIRYRDANDYFEVLCVFNREVKSGLHNGARCLPAILNKRLAELPRKKKNEREREM